jgi:hypothetical protein
MTIIESIKRLKFTFSKQNKINEVDIDAFNVLLQSYSEIQSNKIENNIVYAKILCLYLTLRYEIGSNDINIVIRFLERELEKPLEFHLDKLSNKMRVTQLTNFIKTLKVDLTDDDLKDVESLIKSEEKFWDFNKDEIINEIVFLNSKEQIMNNFYMTANQILNNQNFKL